MSKECDICGKKALNGYKVSHSHRRSKKKWQPNLSMKRLAFDGLIKKVKICNSCLKTYIKKAV